MTGRASNEVVIVKTNGRLLFSTICVGLWLFSGCAHQTPYNPYPQQYPQYPPQYQGYPYGTQGGQPIQPSPMVGIAPGGMQTGYPVQPTGFQGQPQMYPMQQGQTFPGNPGPPPNNPLIGR